MDIVAQLKTERDKAARQLNALDTAIRALSGLNSTRATRGRRTMSAAARRKISASQKARWARARGQKVVSIAPKRRSGECSMGSVTGLIQRAESRGKAPHLIRGPQLTWSFFLPACFGIIVAGTASLDHG